MMNRKLKFVCFLMLFAFACMASSMAEAKLQLKITNKTGRKIFVAVAFQPGSSTATKGWYGVEANSSKTVVIDEYIPGSSFLGFYAKNAPAKGEKKLYWQSKGEGYPGKLPIHHTKSFLYWIAEGGGDDQVGEGAVMVGFRKLKYKSDGNGNATSSLTISP